MSYQPPAAQASPQGGNQRTIIIIVIIVLVLCCCCAAIGIGFYLYGDQLVKLISTPAPTTPLLLKLLA